MNIKIAIVLGTRPEIVKMSPLIRYCQKKKINFFILHSGQHYDHNMDDIFFKDLDLPKPKYNLHVGSQPYGKHVSMMMKGMTKILLEEQPDVVIVQGDTLTVLMGALAAKKWDIPVAHHEAGLRSHDMTMPEETNRILTDHISEILLCPTKDALNNVKEEGLNTKCYALTGNAIVDAVKANIEIADKKKDVLKKLKLKPKKFILVTAHRSENTNDRYRLEGIYEGLKRVKNRYPEYTILFPMHPRTRMKTKEFNMIIPKEIKVIKPVGFLEMLQLEKNAALIITDSGGLQEECSILHTPVVTVRDNTERPETIEAGMNILAGADPQKILMCSEEMLKRKIVWQDVFGDGTAGQKIIDQTIAYIQKRKSFKERFKWVMRLIKKNLRSIFHI